MKSWKWVLTKSCGDPIEDALANRVYYLDGVSPEGRARLCESPTSPPVYWPPDKVDPLDSDLAVVMDALAAEDIEARLPDDLAAEWSRRTGKKTGVRSRVRRRKGRTEVYGASFWWNHRLDFRVDTPPDIARVCEDMTELVRVVAVARRQAQATKDVPAPPQLVIPDAIRFHGDLVACWVAVHTEGSEKNRAPLPPDLQAAWYASLGTGIWPDELRTVEFPWFCFREDGRIRCCGWGDSRDEQDPAKNSIYRAIQALPGLILRVAAQREEKTKATSHKADVAWRGYPDLAAVMAALSLEDAPPAPLPEDVTELWREASERERPPGKGRFARVQGRTEVTTTVVWWGTTADRKEAEDPNGSPAFKKAVAACDALPDMVRRAGVARKAKAPAKAPVVTTQFLCSDYVTVLGDMSGTCMNCGAGPHPEMPAPTFNQPEPLPIKLGDLYQHVLQTVDFMTPKGEPMPKSTYNTPATQSDKPTLLDELMEDGVEVAYREAGREATQLAHDLLVDVLAQDLPTRERDLGRDLLRQMLAGEAGVALVGAAASFGLPALARVLGRGEDPRVLRLARECRREGVRPAAQRLLGKVKELAGGAVGKLLGLLDRLPAEPAPKVVALPGPSGDSRAFVEADLVSREKARA